MCGIAGTLNASGHETRAVHNRLSQVVQVQHHRGPDATGVYVDDKVGFAHNRLSILDLSDAGKQPMLSRSGRCVITYNGEVYNFQELAEKYRLELRSRSDTEVILEAFEKIGPAIFEELNGMFAFAIHDIDANAVWVVRDRLGIKPLYIASQDGQLDFASEIKGLFALRPDMARCLRRDALHEWTYFGNALGARTMFEGVDQLQPGHYLRVDLQNGLIEDRVYWDLATAQTKLRRAPAQAGGLAAAAVRTRELLDLSVRRQLVSDVPVAILLSGGLDSSSIACLASRHSAKPLATYSAAFDYDPERSELALAAEVARHCGSNHHEILIEGAQGADVVRKMVASHDQPFSDAANIPLYLMSGAVSSTHKVILQGDAGDEMFAGYQRHLTLNRYGKYRGLFRAMRWLGNLPINDRRYARAARILSALGASDDAKAMALLLTVEREQQQPTRIFGAALQNQIAADDPFLRYREVDAKLTGMSMADKMLLTDKAIILPDIFFQKVDRPTMAASVEVRVPFADNDLVDHVLGLSPDILMHGGIQKGLLRKAMMEVLPPAVLAGKKRGFGVPFGYWVTGVFSEQFRDVTADVAGSRPGLLNTEQIDLMWQAHKAGEADHSFMFWKILNLSLWIQEYDVQL